ncbi:MAG: hypothetical protein GY801_28370 [bacterium]|nr:hypothetical protein [bacterium]
MAYTHIECGGLDLTRTPCGSPSTASAVEDFLEKLENYTKQVPGKTLLPAFLSLGGFTEDALRLCRTRQIGTAEKIAHF